MALLYHRFEVLAQEVVKKGFTMAKQNRNKLIGLIVTLAVLFASVITTWAVYGEDIEDNTTKLSDLKKEGCDPTGKIPVMLYRLDSIDEKQKEFSIEQKAMRRETGEGFKAILDELKK
ncbi:hypothetical protein LCGC14_2386700 [marine sediment metagenome]|uniref:Uncharacterized protein n=1 Tax=marine sediment metagenome TaxID=412755 RepID=A0A0F9CLI9_9ZZZZ